MLKAFEIQHLPLFFFFSLQNYKTFFSNMNYDNWIILQTFVGLHWKCSPWKLYNWFGLLSTIRRQDNYWGQNNKQNLSVKSKSKLIIWANITKTKGLIVKLVLSIHIYFNTILRSHVDWIKSSLLLMIQWKEHHNLYEHGCYRVQDF